MLDLSKRIIRTLVRGVGRNMGAEKWGCETLPPLSRCVRESKGAENEVGPGRSTSEPKETGTWRSPFSFSFAFFG